MNKQRGLTIVEALVALSILFILSGIVYNSFTLSETQAIMTRNRMVALLIASTLGEELQAHPFGSPAPKHWPSDEAFDGNWQAGRDSPQMERVNSAIEGRPSPMWFHKQLEFQQGSFVNPASVNKPNLDWDRATITITWQERGGESTGARSGQHELKVDMDLWRPY
jgi:type II secretory pathway pseudopilin PulG